MAEKIGIRPAAIIIKNGKVLLVKSNYGQDDFYLFPGGGMEFNETIESCVVRETLEETGVRIKIKYLFHVNEYIYADDWNKRSISIFFIAEPIKISQPLTDDNGKIKQIRWIRIKELHNHNIKPKIIVELIRTSKNLKNPRIRYSVDFKK